MINLALIPLLYASRPLRIRNMAETPYTGGDVGRSPYMDVRRSPIRPLVKVQSYRDRWVRSTRAGRADQDKWEWGSRVVWWENHATWWESHDSWLARNSAWQNAEAEDEEIRRMEEGSGVGNLEHQLRVEAEENRRISAS